MIKDMVNNPFHYGGKDNPYEAIKVIEAWELGFCLGNTIKYISRAGKKDSTKIVEDLKKAQWYLNHEIERLSIPTSKLDETDKLLQAAKDLDDWIQITTYLKKWEQYSIVIGVNELFVYVKNKTFNPDNYPKIINGYDVKWHWNCKDITGLFKTEM